MECLRDKFNDRDLLDGRFETVSPLNHGSFGMVFTAKDLKSGDLVAIKCLTKSTCDDSHSSFVIGEYSKELVCHAQLGSHANIVNLIHSFQTPTSVYLVLEFCSRGDLYEAIRTGTGPLETENVRHFMLQLIGAVEYMHGRGLFHRDIKPENIFLTESGVMKLGDFGLATSEEWTYEERVGSDRYMSPEQYDSDGAGYAPEYADIWAIGICLLNILFSRNPFATPTESDPLFLDFSRDKQSLFDVFPTMSQDTYEVIAQCMNLDPRKRSLEGAREALNRVVSFTTIDESFDDFCSAERRGVTNTNRKPLRTPSIQSLQASTALFSWARASRAAPNLHFRQMSAIQDHESYHSKDLFSISEESAIDWVLVGNQTPSLATMPGSSLVAFMKSHDFRQQTKAESQKASITPISTMSKSKALTSLSSLFSKKDDVASKKME
ncbi:kinase-like protein [Cadophora sp. DSE1049]|nr:kinase-like protein [Cadophora sp. DSE1049]